MFQELWTPGAMPTWDKAAIQQMLQGLSGYQDVPRLASDVEEVVREIRSLHPKVDCLGMVKFMYFCASGYGAPAAGALAPPAPAPPAHALNGRAFLSGCSEK